MTTNQNSTKENAYILRSATDESYDTMEQKFFGASWEPRLDSVDYLESLIKMYPEKFADCEIVIKEVTIPNPEHRRQILIENANQFNHKDVKFFAEIMSENDPGFYRWLFESEWNDFYLPENASDAYNEFMQSLPTE